jgi:hypothetical protein
LSTTREERAACGGRESQKTSEQHDVPDALRKRTPDNPLCALSSENFSVRPEIFPATRLRIPCSAAQGIDCKRLILRDDWTQ